ncbi:hypothetical protein, partial [Glaciecola sp. KUL10]|uniref:hypothetical protein n=1 Tax=Glaciecola sp. (strain KUL10) TaxID=2161813 RepID=UPI00131401B8
IVIEPIQVFLSRSSISLTHDVGLSNCPNDFDPVSVSITDNQAFTIENVSINGSLSSLIDVDISPATSSEAKSIQARFNCLSFSAGSFSGTITATAINDVSGATQTFSINVSLEVSEQELPINLSTSSISLTHTVGESSCPDDYDLVIAESALDEDFTIKDIQVSGDVASRIDVDVTPNTPNFTQTIAVSFNCSNTIVGNFSGTLTMTAEDVATGREKQLSLQINLSVNSVPFNITLSNSSLIDEHVVGTDACPQLIGDVEINSTSSKDFIISGLSVSDSSVANVIEAQTLSNSPSTSQTVRVEFNCDDATNNVYRGTVSGNAEHPSTGESISFEIDIEFEVSTPPIDYLIDPNPVQNIYTVGSSNCPSRLTEVVLQHNNNEDLLLAEVQMIGTLSSDINLSFEPSLGSEDSLHIIYVTFNCNDLTPGIRTGTITGEVEEFDTGIFETFTVDVTLEVVDGVRLRLGVVESSLGSGSSLPSQAVNNELLDFSAQETKPEVIPELVTQNSEGTQTSRPNGLIRKLPNDEPALTPRKTRSGTLLSTELASEELAELKEVLQNANVEPTLEAAPNDGSPIQNNEATETNNELPLIEENSTQSGFVVQRVEQNRSINISDQANQRQNLRAQKLQADRLSAEKLESRRLQANSLSTKNISADSLFDSQNQSLQIIEDRQNALQQKFQEREARAAQFQQDRINNWLKRNRLQRIESTQKETNASEAQTQQSQGADDDK